jgi:hypothetical protein
MKLARFFFLPGQPTNFAGADKPEISAIWNYIQSLERRLAEGLNKSSSYDSFTYLSAQPEKYWAGMEVLADGLNWDPGSGEGKYRRNFANSAWVFLG